MLAKAEIFLESLGAETKEVLGYQTEEDLENALIPLMQESK